ncbi:MAG: ISAs1 family transposase, partial [Anaerolineales bacterium]
TPPRNVRLEYSTRLPFGAGHLFYVTSLWGFLAQGPDQRQRQGVRYPLVVLLVLSVLAKLAGEDEVTGIAEWVRWRAAWWVSALHLKRPSLPHRTTYSRVFGHQVTPSALERRVSEFLQQLPQDGVPIIINLDGKTVRGTIPRGQSQGLHLLAAYLPESGIVLLQVVVETKENEIPASVRVVQLLDLQGKIITGDAVGTQFRTHSTRTVRSHRGRRRRLRLDGQREPPAVAERHRSSLCDHAVSQRP